MSSTTTERRAATTAERDRCTRILAKSLVRDLLHDGYEPSDVINLATHIIEHVTAHVSKEGAKTARHD
jgi:hypothetical protein